MNTEAVLKVVYMFDTLAVFQSPMGWLKAVASSNMLSMAVTLAVLHEPMLKLKTVAP